MGRALTLQRLTHLVSTPGRILLTTLVGGLVILLAFTGVAQTFAVWNSQATATGSATGAQLDLTTDFGNAAADFANHRTSVTGSFTLTNQTITTSTIPGTYSATIAAPGTSTLRSVLTVTIWLATDDGCTTAVNPTNIVATGTWAQSPFTVGGSLLAGQTTTYCMRMETSERSALASPSGALVINPSITASLTIGSWSDSANGAVVQKTEFMFPAANPTENVWYQLVNVGNNRCASVATNGNLTAANCTSSDNRSLKFTATGDGYQEIVPRNTTNRRLDIAGAATTAGAAVNTQSFDASRPSQDWQMQFKGDNGAGAATYQIVNRLSGLCVEAASSSYSQQICNGTSAQAFTLTTVGVDVTLTLDCTSNAGTVTYQLTGAAAGEYVFAFQNGTSGTYTQYSPAVTTGSTSVTFTPAQIGSLLTNGLNGLQVTWLGYVLTTDTVWKDGNGSSAPLACKAPTLEALTCTQSSPRSVVISWGHTVPNGVSYTIAILAGTGGAGDTQLAVVSSGTSHTLTANNWADGTRTIRVASSATGRPVVDIQVAKSSYDGTERLWCLTDVSSSVTVTCSPTGNENRATNVTVWWPTGATRGSWVMLEITGDDEEVFRAVTTSSATGTSSFTVPADAFPRGQVVVNMTRIGDTGTGGFVLGTKTFDTERNSGTYYSRCS